MLLVFALLPWIALAWWIEQWFGCSTQSIAFASSISSFLISVVKTLPDWSFTGSYCE